MVDEQKSPNTPVDKEAIDREFKNRERMMCTCRIQKRFKKRGLLSKWTHEASCILMQRMIKS